MNFRIELKQPTISRKIFALLWLGFIALFVIVGWLREDWTFAFVGVPATLLLGAWQLTMLNQLYSRITELIFYEGQWFVIENGLKVVIEIKKDTVCWPWWVALKFRQLDPSKPSISRQLMLFRDAMSDSEFRHLSRTLKFYKAS